jgi:hypothetical protein
LEFGEIRESTEDGTGFAFRTAMQRYVKSGLWLIAALFLCFSAQAVTLEELVATPNLTPETLAARFSDFEFKFHEEVQNPHVFLASQSGDCDDYATVAAYVLSKHGYSPRLIAIRMKGETHVVCYIPETKTYLDYNCRKDLKKTVPCSGEITDIARKVALSFGRDWVATYEFTFSFDENVKRLVDRIVPNRSTANARRPV